MGLAGYRMLLLGAPMSTDAKGSTTIPATKGYALLWYCATQPGRFFPRTFLAEMFWGHTRGNRNSLSSALTRLRQSLPHWPLLQVGEALGWTKGGGLEVDIHRFADLVDPAGQGELPDRIRRLEEAISLRRGPFLDGISLSNVSETFESWLAQTRSEWDRRVLNAFSELIGFQESILAWDRVRVLATNALEIDPLEEHFHRLLMKANHRLGNRAAALLQFASCEKTLHRELGVSPEPETFAVRESILREESLAVPGGESHTIAVPVVDGPSGLPEPDWPLRSGGKAEKLPLLGRDEMMRVLGTVMCRAGTGSRRAVLLEGEAGVGKTRLVEEMIAENRRLGAKTERFATLLWGHCHEEFQGIRFFPWVDAVNRLLPGLDVAGLHIPEVGLREMGRLIPELNPVPDRLPVSLPVGFGGNTRALFEGMVRFLAALPQPVWAVLEDLHWADEETLFFWSYLSRHAESKGIVQLATIRSGEISARTQRLLNRLVREGHLERLEVPPLALEDIRSMTKALLGPSQIEWADWVYAQSQGLPLIAIELLRARKVKEPCPNDDREEADFPYVLKDFVADRVAKLPPVQQNLLAAGSIFPDGASFGILTTLTDLDETEAIAALEELIRSGFLREVESREHGSGTVRPTALDRQGGPNLIFAVDLVRRIIRDSISLSRIQVLERRAQRVLEGAGGQQVEGKTRRNTGGKPSLPGSDAQGVRYN